MEQKNIINIKETKWQKLVLGFILLLILFSAILHIHLLFTIPGLDVLDDNDFIEGLMLVIIILLMPLLTIYISLKDYFRMQPMEEVFIFTRSFIKQIIIILAYGLITGILIVVSEYGKEPTFSLFTLFIPIMFGGLIFSLIVTSIINFLSKRNLNK